VIRYIFGIAKSVFWVVARAVVMDGFILAQIMFFMMRKRRRAYRPPQNKFK
jgi:membrane-bound ClpP family serine protease